MKKSVLVLGLAFALVGCGGSGGGNSAPVTKPEVLTGLYANQQDRVLMLVDTARQTDNIIVGDFLSNAVMVAHSIKQSGNVIDIKGLTYVDVNTIITDSTVEAKAQFDNGGVQVSGTLNAQILAYNFEKVEDTKSLIELSGSYTNHADGYVWTIDGAGNLTINGDCLMSGALKRNGVYFDLENVTVSNCKIGAMNGVYKGVLVSAKHGGVDYIAGVVTNDNYTIWGSVNIN
ncbi:hypothetical protein ABMX69_06905 [Vibrio vulnificus]|uniref:hypothetical protein n=1 Tax=Vibrio vulnificus TaxID=672 RepID=UPI004057E13E